MCCVITCRKDAEFDIFGGSGHFEDTTQACEDHVGSLLGSPDWLAPKDNTQWTVVALETEPSALSNYRGEV